MLKELYHRLIHWRLGREREPVGSRPPMPLEEALRAATRNPRRAPEFFRSFLEGELHAPARRRAGSVDPERAFSHVELVAYEDAEGVPFVPLFSRREFLPRDLGEGVHRVAMPGRQLLELARGQRVVLNPGRDPQKVFDSDLVSRILDHLAR